MIIIKFSDFPFRRENQDFLGTIEQGEQDFPKLEKKILQSPESSPILFDISGYSLFAYSYSKQTIRRLLINAKSGSYGRRYFLVYSPNEEYSEELSAALREKKLAMICSTSKARKKYYDSYYILGELSEPLKYTLDYIIKKNKITSGQLKNELNLESYQTASNRIKKLNGERLVRWEESPSRVRNVLDCSRIES
jgi:hypothetical protein